MFTNDDLALLAESSSSHVAQKIIFNLGKQYEYHLARNTNLDPALWEKLHKCAFFRNRVSLYINSPSAELADKILKERDMSVVFDSVEAGIKNLTVASTHKLIENHAGENAENFIRAGVLTSGSLPNNLVLKNWELFATWAKKSEFIVSSIYTNVLVKVASQSNVLPPLEVVRLFEEVLLPNGRDYPSSLDISRCLDLRPELIPYLLRSDHATCFLVPISGSQHIRDDSAQEVVSILEKSLSHIPLDVAAEVATNLYINPSVPYKIRAAYVKYVNTRVPGVIPSRANTHLDRLYKKFTDLDNMGVEPLKCSWDKADSFYLLEVLQAVSLMAPWRFPSLDGKILDSGLNVEYSIRQKI